MSAVVIATTSAVISAQAAQRAHDAQVQVCKLVEKSFDSHTATVEQAKEYADCIQMLHPNPMNAHEIIILKIGVVLFLIGAAIGGVFGFRDGWSLSSSLVGMCLFALAIGLTFPLVVIILVGIAQAICFLFGG